MKAWYNFRVEICLYCYAEGGNEAMEQVLSAVQAIRTPAWTNLVGLHKDFAPNITKIEKLNHTECAVLKAAIDRGDAES